MKDHLSVVANQLPALPCAPLPPLSRVLSYRHHCIRYLLSRYNRKNFEDNSRDDARKVRLKEIEGLSAEMRGFSTGQLGAYCTRARSDKARSNDVCWALCTACAVCVWCVLRAAVCCVLRAAYCVLLCAVCCVLCACVQLCNRFLHLEIAAGAGRGTVFTFGLYLETRLCQK